MKGRKPGNHPQAQPGRRPFNEAGPVKGRKPGARAGVRAAAGAFNEAGPVKGRKLGLVNCPIIVGDPSMRPAL